MIGGAYSFSVFHTGYVRMNVRRLYECVYIRTYMILLDSG